MIAKVIVVDDEYWIRKGILSKIDWEKYGFMLIGEASNGDEALNIIRNLEPHIAIIDIKMPVMDGLNVIKQVKEYGIFTKFIIISGYNDFDYAKQAIKLGVSEYILKPVEDGVLLEVLLKLKTELEAEASENERVKTLESRLSENGVLIRDSMLNDLIFNERKPVRETNHLNDSGILFENGKYSVAVLWLSGNVNSEICIQSTRVLLDTLAERFEGMIYIKSSRKDREFIIIFNMEKLSLNKVKFILKTTIEKTSMGCGAVLTIGYGNTVSGIGNLHSSYLLAYNALRNMVLTGSNKVYSSDELNSEGRSTDYVSDDLKVLLDKYVLDSNIKPVLNNINNTFEKISSDIKALNYIIFEDICFKLFSVVEKFYKETDEISKTELQRKINFYEIIEDFNNIEDARQWFIAHLENPISYLPPNTASTGESIILKIRDYINRFYYEQISLKDISDKFFIHPNYLCRAFKEKIGKGFNEYLTGIRLNKALELMNNPNMKIEDISSAVGYENQRYFSYIFKKHFGMTPSKYTKKHSTSS